MVLKLPSGRSPASDTSNRAVTMSPLCSLTLSNIASISLPQLLSRSYSTRSPVIRQDWVTGLPRNVWVFTLSEIANEMSDFFCVAIRKHCICVRVYVCGSYNRITLLPLRTIISDFSKHINQVRHTVQLLPDQYVSCGHYNSFFVTTHIHNLASSNISYYSLQLYTQLLWLVCVYIPEVAERPGGLILNYWVDKCHSYCTGGTAQVTSFQAKMKVQDDFCRERFCIGNRWLERGHSLSPWLLGIGEFSIPFLEEWDWMKHNKIQLPIMRDLHINDVLTNSIASSPAKRPLSLWSWAWLWSEVSSILPNGEEGFSIESSCSERDVRVTWPPGEGWNIAPLEE